jgi:hypothetical protein
LIFCLFLFGNVLGCADESPDFAGGIAHRKPVNPDPTNVSVRERNPETLVEFSRAGRLVKLAEHVDTVFRMDYVLIRSRVIQQALASSAGDGFVRLIHLQNFLRIRIKHPENLLDMTGHLAITFFALPVLPHTSDQEPGSRQYDHNEA